MTGIRSLIITDILSMPLSLLDTDLIEGLAMNPLPDGLLVRWGLVVAT